MGRITSDRKLHTCYNKAFINFYKEFIKNEGFEDILIEEGRAYGSSPIQTFYCLVYQQLLKRFGGLEYRSYPGKLKYINGKSFKSSL